MVTDNEDQKETKTSSDEDKTRKRRLKEKKLRALKRMKKMLKTLRLQFNILAGLSSILVLAIVIMTFKYFYDQNAPTSPISRVTNQDWIRGNRYAKISIIEYSDTECPSCKSWHEELKEVVDTYDEVNWVYRHYPIEELHSKAFNEALATECVGNLGGNDKFWDYLDMIFTETESNDSLDEDKLKEFAKDININEEAFTKCLDDKKYEDKINDDIREVNLYSVTNSARIGTPFAIIRWNNYEFLAGGAPKESLMTVIDLMLDKDEAEEEGDQQEEVIQEEETEDTGNEEATKEDEETSEESAE